MAQVLATIEFLPAELGAVRRVQHFFDHLNELRRNKGLTNIGPAVVENQKVAVLPDRICERRSGLSTAESSGCMWAFSYAKATISWSSHPKHSILREHSPTNWPRTVKISRRIV
jgi:hypothetical protein